MDKKLRKKIIYGFIIWAALLVIYLPIFVMVVFSFSEGRAVNTDNFEFGFGAWTALFGNRDIMMAVLNTVIIATVSAALGTIMGVMACVGIARLRKRSRGFLMTINQVPLINATIVTSFSLVLFFGAMGMLNMGLLRVVLAHTLICLPIAILVIMPRLRSLDQNLFEAAQDLGARPFFALFKVVIPQLIPAMFTAFLLGFTISLDDFILTQFNAGGIRTISTVVYTARMGIPPEMRALSAFIFGFVILVLIVLNISFAKRAKKELIDN